MKSFYKFAKINKMDKLGQTPHYLTQAVKIIDRWLNYQQIVKRIPGIAVAIVYKDESVLMKGYGYEDLATKNR